MMASKGNIDKLKNKSLDVLNIAEEFEDGQESEVNDQSDGQRSPINST